MSPNENTTPEVTTSGNQFADLKPKRVYLAAVALAKRLQIPLKIENQYDLEAAINAEHQKAISNKPQ